MTVKKITIGDSSIFSLSGDPSGSLSSNVGDLAIDTVSGTLHISAGGSSWSAVGGGGLTELSGSPPDWPTPSDGELGEVYDANGSAYYIGDSGAWIRNEAGTGWAAEGGVVGPTAPPTGYATVGSPVSSDGTTLTCGGGTGSGLATLALSDGDDVYFAGYFYISSISGAREPGVGIFRETSTNTAAVGAQNSSKQIGFGKPNANQSVGYRDPDVTIGSEVWIEIYYKNGGPQMCWVDHSPSPVCAVDWSELETWTGSRLAIGQEVYSAVTGVVKVRAGQAYIRTP